MATQLGSGAEDTDTTRDWRHQRQLSRGGPASHQDDSGGRDSGASQRRDEAARTATLKSAWRGVPRWQRHATHTSTTATTGRLPRTHGRACGPSATQSGPTSGSGVGSAGSPYAKPRRRSPPTPALSPPHFTAGKALEKEERERERAKPQSARRERPGFLPPCAPLPLPKKLLLSFAHSRATSYPSGPLVGQKQ